MLLERQDLNYFSSKNFLKFDCQAGVLRSRGGTRIIAVNEDLEDAAETINEDPYGAWLVKIRPTATLNAEGLLNVTAYRAKVEAG